MDIQTSLYNGEHICLAPIDHGSDAAVEARWTHDAEYLRLVSTEPARPLSAAQLKKQYEQYEKQMENGKNFLYFTLRMRLDDRLIGFVSLYAVSWSNGAGMVRLGIGDPSDRRQGYGSEALRLIVRYAFGELNLYRLGAVVPEYNTGALRLFEKGGFVREVCRRQALHRFGQRWDVIHLGILHDEWEAGMAGSSSELKEERGNGE